MPSDIPMSEWEKIFDMLPEEIINSNQGEIIGILPGLRYPIQIETVASDIFFPTAKSSRGNTCPQLFTGNISDRWSVYPLRKESQNGTAL